MSTSSTKMSRRRCVQRGITLAAFLTCYPLRHIFAATDALAKQMQSTGDIGNFKYIYQNEELRQEFFPFLINVFHLYPEKEFHAAIEQTSNDLAADREIYSALQKRLSELKPFLGDLTYALPALKKQKQIMLKQTLQLLGDRKKFEGYLEFGTTGRYISELEDQLSIQGETYLVHDRAPTFSPIDLAERGQLTKIGKYIPMNNYQPALSSQVPKNSIDLVTVYIGFHHCPIPLREEFISSIRDVMRPGASMIVRDHNVHNEKMNRIAGLAHDVFNLGTQESWGYNADELRNFYSLEFLREMLTKQGLHALPGDVYQEGDPTLNALLHFKKA